MNVLEAGFFRPINSPIWDNLIGLHLQIGSPWWLGLRGKILRQILHLIGLLEFVIIRKNHLSQSVYVVLRKG